MFQTMPSPTNGSGESGNVFDRIYTISTLANSSTSAVIQIATFVDDIYSAVTINNNSGSYNDDYIQISYNLYWNITIKKDAIVNGVEQTASYNTNWHYSECGSLFIEFK